MDFDFNRLSIGADVEKISRFEKYSDKDDTFVKRIFSDAEIEYCYSNKNFAQHLAVRYCAKEAILKALTSFGISIHSYSDFEILNKESGEPYVKVLNADLPDLQFKLSLSHNVDTAIATVIVYKV
jgi:phosphopantetheine--protein transferase-like protein